MGALVDPAPAPQGLAASAIPFQDEDFRFIARFVFDRCGIVLGENKRQLVYGRLLRRLRELGMRSFTEYCRRLKEHPGEELDPLSSAITTNVTGFFREEHHFEYLADTLLPTLAAEGGSGARLRLWSAGCASGEEAYSMAVVLRETLGEKLDVDARVLATDLSPRALAVGEAGVYPLERLKGLSDARRRRWFSLGTGENAGKARVSSALRSPVVFRQLNLLREWPMRGPFDAIFCRNVAIYFDTQTKQRLFARFSKLLAPGGHLFIGHSESLLGVCDSFEHVGRTIYRRRP